jgi:hypothetical protein
VVAPSSPLAKTHSPSTIISDNTGGTTIANADSRTKIEHDKLLSFTEGDSALGIVIGDRQEARRGRQIETPVRVSCPGRYQDTIRTQTMPCMVTLRLLPGSLDSHHNSVTP